MKRTIECLALASVALAGCSGAVVSGATSCPEGMIARARATCEPVSDRTAAATGPSDELAAQLPQRTMSPPGELAIESASFNCPGITWIHGQLQSTRGANLNVQMIVHPEGIANIPGFLYTTSTNHTPKSLEILASYSGTSNNALAIFDWSCSQTDPCTVNNSPLNGPGYVYWKQLTDLPCYLAGDGEDGSLNQHRVLEYQNVATPGANGRWSNTAYVLNHCTNVWDALYSHSYAAPTEDCAQTDCMWWGPIVESHMTQGQDDVDIK